jgi:LacI family transcriptional regulator
LTLLHGGRRLLTLLNGPARISAYNLRSEGFWRAIRDFGDDRVTADEKVTEMGYASGVAAVDELFARRSRPDAILCSADTTAAGVLEQLGKLGRAVPGDVAVTGFDDIEYSRHSTPPLSTVRMPLHDTGAAAVSLLLEMLTGHGATPEPRVLQTEVIERESSAG